MQYTWHHKAAGYKIGVIFILATYIIGSLCMSSPP